MENIFVEFLPPWVETGLQPAFYDKESGTVLQQTARMYARVNMLIRMFNKLSRNTKTVVEDYINKFNQLHDYVYYYFDNLDVQEEINNKLDDMAESGQLADIIAAYIQLRGILAYDTVADLKNANNVVVGSFVETLGYYTKGDSGSAKYKIRKVTNDDVIDEATLIEITSDPANELVAELVLSDEMNTKQFGLKGDNSTDETTNFTTALNACKKLNILAGTYIIDRFLLDEYHEVEGIGDVTIKTKGTAPQVVFSSFDNITNVKFKSTNATLPWNRAKIDTVSNINITGCSFEDFKDTSPSPNAWGVLMSKCSNINMKDCYFNGSSQADLAIVDGCKNIHINNCYGDNFRINIEPNYYTNNIDNVTFTNCKIAIASLQENSYEGTNVRSMIFEDCTIDRLRYDGSTVTFINCLIDSYENAPQNNVIFAGNMKFINTGNFTKNLLNDPYLDIINPSTSVTNQWCQGYWPVQASDCIATVKDGDGIQTVINPNNTSQLVMVKYDGISVNEGQSYLLRINGKADYPIGASYNSLLMTVKWLDSEDNTIGDVNRVSMFRGTVESTTDFLEQSIFLKAPEGATKCNLTLMNGTSPTEGVVSKTKIYFRSIELFGINNTKNPNVLTDLPVRDKRIFNASNIPASNSLNYNVGDRLYYDDPTTNLGSVCTVAGSPGTWRNF